MNMCNPHNFTHIHTYLHIFTQFYRIAPPYRFNEILCKLHNTAHIHTYLHSFTVSHRLTALMHHCVNYTILHIFTHIYTVLPYRIALLTVGCHHWVATWLTSGSQSELPQLLINTKNNIYIRNSYTIYVEIFQII